MPFSARSRPGTTPSFWRGYHSAQMSLAASCMRKSSARVVREDSIQELIADFEKRKTAAAGRFVTIPSR
jgi:hypothetical protein